MLSGRAGRAAALVAAFVLGGLAVGNVRLVWREPSAQAGQNDAGRARALGADEIYARAAATGGRSVVNIDTVRLQRTRSFFFEDSVQRVSGSGSGVIISADGDILTNEHVVAGAERIRVTLHNGQQFDGRVVGRDRSTDVALVRINASGLSAARIGTSSDLVVGQIAVAIGNPLGLRFTVTHGIVSALGRPLKLTDRVYENLIQTDCAINPGNSGGALVDLQGRLIGVNTLVASSGQGIGFAIPIDLAMRIAAELKRNGKVKRPWLGMYYSAVTPRVQAFYGLSSSEGALVEGVVQDGPADRAGVEAGDIVQEFDGKRVRDDDDLRRMIDKAQIGRRVPIVILRDGQSARGEIAVTEAP